MTDRKPMIRPALGILLAIFVFINIAAVGVLGRPQVAQAVLPVTDPALLALFTVDKVGDDIFQVIWDGLVGAVLSGATFFAQRLAYDAAVSFANASPGKMPLFQNKSFGTYLEDIGKDAAGEALNKLAKDWVGLDLCKPIDIRANLAIQIGLRQAFTQPTVKCSLSKIGDNWENQWETLKKQYGGCGGGATGAAGAAARGGRTASGSVEDCMMALARDVFKPTNTELGISVQASVKIQDTIRRKEIASTKEREEGGGFKAVTDIITGNVKTPAKSVEKESEKLSSTKQEDRSFQLISGTMASGAKGALIGTLSMFANTFLSQLGNRAMKGLFETKPGGGGGVELTPLMDADGGSQVIVSPQVTALLTQTISVRDAGLYDTLSQFVSCPSESGDINRRPDECVLDADFEAAVRSAESGDPLTIKQAMEKNLLHANWRLVSPSDVGLNTDVDCRNQAYCHSNIAKLRQARIVPLGFEIAAALSPRDSQWTLGEVVAGFNDCNAQGDRAADKPFCHLIDPNWILKAPLTRCKAEVPGPMLATRNSNIRHDICVDKPTCLQDDGKGGCESPWGYCVREKNIWRFNGDSCPAQFSTCATYTGVSPGAQKKATYLSRTVDFGVCTEQDVGCRRYATTQVRNPDARGNYAWNESPKAYFNGKATTCTQSGCSQFIRQDGASAYLKKAPLYLQCYDANPQTETVIEWPEKLADLAKLKPRTECKNYAPVCAKDEVGCTRYAPENGDPPIPAIAGNGDKCAQECVGYSTYKQMPSAFERAKFPLYFIPETANQCSGADVGCDQFVNVERGEKAEYYSFVRQCEKPAPNNTNSVVFYAWEGSDAQGYQLRSYVLKRGPRMYQEDPTDVTPMYTAAYDKARVSSYQELCNKDLYTQRLADPDCRELFDKDGNAYYRLLSKTITVSDECTTMRKTDADIYYASRDVIKGQAECTDAKGAWNERDGCQICEGGGALQNGVCLYAMMKSEATSCRAEASGCRAYTGNAGNNVRVAYQAKFDDLDTTGWSKGTLSAESVVVGGKSLRVDGRNVSLSISSTPAAGSQYHMNFWAKGQGTLTVTFDRTDAEPSNRATFRLTGDWHQFSLGPVYVKSVEAGAAIVFAVNQNAPLFMDNIVIRETIDTVNVVKDSWKTPLTCDANPNDKDGAGNPIPGEALGCQLYRDHNDAPVSLKSFTRICRDEAVGCEKLTDTHNTQELEGKTYLVRCGAGFGDTVDPASSACTTKLDGDGDGQPDNKQVCTLPLGKDYCTFTMNRVFSVAAQEDDNRLAYVISIPADSISYLVNRQEFRCDAKEKGCIVLGEAKGAGASGTTTTTNKLVDPDKYDQLLCTGDAEGCEAYSSNVGGAARTTYFRDPSVTGRPLCEYKENVDGNSGWFVQGTANPCYVGYRVTGNLFGVKSQGDQGYSGNVGLCPEQNNACKEFRDPADTSQLYPEGQPYYVLDNAKIDKSSCNGQASLQEGCVLFNDTSVPAKPWNSVKTYGLSSAKNGGLVAPASVIMNAAGGVACISEGCYRPEPQDANAKCRDGYRLETMVYRDAQGNITRTTYNCVVPKNDANTILKVTRDRACGEWLACLSSVVRPDPATNQLKSICNNVARCNAYSKTNEKFEQCTSWVGTSEFDGRILDAATYSQRTLGWNAMDYSGYAQYDRFQINEYRFVRRGDGTYKLVAIPFKYVDAERACRGRGENESCGEPLARRGLCLGGVCTAPLGKSTPRQGEQCRGYANTDAPFTFPDEQVEWEPVEYHADGRPKKWLALLKEMKGVSGFDRAAVCQWGHQCSCSYQTADYGRGEFTRYYNASSHPPSGLCRGGYTDVGKDKTGRSCESNIDCKDERTEVRNRQIEAGDRRDGECVFLDRISEAKGWTGYCLEVDRSIRTPGSGIDGHPCLTWMPLDVVPGASSISDQVQEAGYQPEAFAPGGQYYCAESAATATTYSGEQCRKLTGRTSPMSCAEYYSAGMVGYEAWVNGVWRTLSDCDSCADSVESGSSLAATDDGLPRFSLAMIDYIEIEFNDARGTDDDSPLPGIIRIVNDSAKPRVYAVNQATCDTIIQSAGWQGDEQIQPQCITSGGEEERAAAYGGHAGLSMMYTLGQTTKLGWMWADGQADSYSRTFGHISNGSVFGDGYQAGTGGGKDGTAADGHILWFVFENGRMTDQVRLNLYNANESGTTAVELTYRIVLRDACWSVASVTDGEENVAQTNRLWDVDARKSLESGGPITLGGQKVVTLEDVQKPFGSAQTPSDNRLLYQHTSYETAATAPKGGAFFYCPNGRCGKEVIPWGAPWPSDSRDSGEGALARLFGRAYRFVVGNNDNRRTLATGYNIDQPTQCQSVAPGAPAGQALGGNNACWDVRALPAYARPPGIASVDTNHCTVSASDEPLCQLGTVGRFTINGQDDGVVFGYGAIAARTRFFTWADTNRGPIRDILVEWDIPGIVAASSGRGKYKNMKPYCQSRDTNSTKTCERNENVTCSTDEECRRSNLGTCRKEDWVSFGNAASRGCKTGHYEFIGAYFFDQDDPHCAYTIGGRSLQGIAADQLQELTERYGLKPGDRYCAFKPKVIIIDNWGWCNGGSGTNQAVGGCQAGTGGCWGNPERARDNICTDPTAVEYTRGLVGTKFNGWVIVAEQK